MLARVLGIEAARLELIMGHFQSGSFIGFPQFLESVFDKRKTGP